MKSTMFYFLFFGISILWIFFTYLANEEIEGDNNPFFEMRKKQSSFKLRENAVKKKFEDILEEKSTISKKYKIETLCLQAGYNLTYGEFKLLSITCAIVISSVVAVGTNNTLLAILCIGIGYICPQQFISFMRNKRISVIEKQVGSFLKLSLERYNVQTDFSQVLEDSVDDLNGQEPLCSEIKKTVLDIQVGLTVTEALHELGRRTGNKYLKRHADYYEITHDLGSYSKNTLLNQSYVQFEENRKMSSILKKQLAGPLKEAYIMVCATPMVVIYQACTSDTYVDFMLNTTTGKIGSAVMAILLIGCVWFINAKIGAPIDE